MEEKLDSSFIVSYATQQLHGGKFVARAYVRRDLARGKSRYEFDFEGVFDSQAEALDNAKANIDAKVRIAVRGE